MYHAYNEGRKNTYKGRSRTAKPRKIQNSYRTGQLLEFGNIGIRDKRKKKVLPTNGKAFENQVLLQKSHQKNKDLGSPSFKTFKIILEIDQG